MSGLEIGFYIGCVRMWRLLQARDNAIISERAERAVASLEELLASIKLDNPEVSCLLSHTLRIQPF